MGSGTWSSLGLQTAWPEGARRTRGARAACLPEVHLSERISGSRRNQWEVHRRLSIGGPRWRSWGRARGQSGARSHGHSSIHRNQAATIISYVVTMHRKGDFIEQRVFSKRGATISPVLTPLDSVCCRRATRYIFGSTLLLNSHHLGDFHNALP